MGPPRVDAYAAHRVDCRHGFIDARGKAAIACTESVLPRWDGTFRVSEEKEVGNGWENRQD
jgi:hypothetical protein